MTVSFLGHATPYLALKLCFTDPWLILFFVFPTKFYLQCFGHCACVIHLLFLAHKVCEDGCFKMHSIWIATEFNGIRVSSKITQSRDSLLEWIYFNFSLYTSAEINGDERLKIHVQVHSTRKLSAVPLIHYIFSLYLN